MKKKLDQQVSQGIIEKVPPNTKSEWCVRTVVVLKKNGNVRITQDLQGLNKWSIRQAHHTDSPFQLAAQIEENNYKSVLDMVDSYHLIPLHVDSRDLTTFITDWGRYRYLKGVQGEKSMGDMLTARCDCITKDVKRKCTCIDDTCLYSKTINESFFQVCEFLSLWPEWHGL